MLLATTGLPGWAAGLTIDFARTNGLIRPLHGVNLGPLCYRGTVDLSPYHRELKVPFTRLHDVVWLNAEAVDIHTLFRDFDRDPEQPASYDFAATDDYLQAITNVGSRIVYRLGESIEHTPRKYWVHPPRDPAKWATICVGVIRHYNEGWADGFRHDIRYWEIWNEPDVRPQMWTGTEEQYLQLYETAAKTIKARFPQLKVGGPAVGNTGSFEGAVFKPAPFLDRFLDHCRRRDVPLDFFSWHCYTADPLEIPRRADAVRRLLDSRGFARTEIHFNEWNYLPRGDWSPMLGGGAGVKREEWYAEMGGPRGAAFAATVLMRLQDSPVDVANYYTGEIQGFGLFTLNGVPKKTFHAFRAFRALLDTPVRVSASMEPAKGWTVGAGLDAGGTAGTILAANFDSADPRLTIAATNLPWKAATRFDVQLLDATHDLTLVQQGGLKAGETIELGTFPAPTVVVTRLTPAK